jgi:hypothetical protein
MHHSYNWRLSNKSQKQTIGKCFDKQRSGSKRSLIIDNSRGGTVSVGRLGKFSAGCKRREN